MLSDILKEAKPKMDERLAHFREQIKTIRASRAEGSLVESIIVTYYGQKTPLVQLASISTPSPNLISILPWDKNALNDIVLAIKNSNLSLNPSDDGNIIRLSLPPLSEERRIELTKLIHDEAEETKISLRTIRQDIWQQVVRAERSHQLSEDERYKGEEELNKMIADYNKQIDEISKQKEKDLMAI